MTAIPLEGPDLNLAKSLVEQMLIPEFDATQYADDYAARVKDIINAKLKGNKV